MDGTMSMRYMYSRLFFTLVFRRRTGTRADKPHEKDEGESDIVSMATQPVRQTCDKTFTVKKIGCVRSLRALGVVNQIARYTPKQLKKSLIRFWSIGDCYSSSGTSSKSLINLLRGSGDRIANWGVLLELFLLFKVHPFQPSHCDIFLGKYVELSKFYTIPLMSIGTGDTHIGVNSFQNSTEIEQEISHTS